MQLYTLDSGFLRKDPIDTFESVIWTERYGSAGDVNLVTDATQEMFSKLAEGTFLSLADSNEVMLLDTREVKDGKLIVTGESLLKFLEHRVIRVTGIAGTPDTADKGTWKITGKTVGQVISHIVNKMLIDPSDLNGLSFYDFDTSGGAVNRELITNLSLGAVDSSGSAIETSVNFGPIYSTIKSLAEQYLLGMSLYLHSASDAGYLLKFKTYIGLDRTSTQSVNAVVRFSPYMDSLTDIKEFRSIAGYKNVIYGFSTSQDDRGSYLSPVTEYVPGANVLSDFARRVLMIYFQTNVDPAVFPTWPGFQDEVRRQLRILMKDALANNNYTKLVDGEIVPQSGFEFGTDYNLGDIIELQGLSGTLQNARITEYIRTQDDAGERGYPTVSIIDD